MEVFSYLAPFTSTVVLRGDEDIFDTNIFFSWILLCSSVVWFVKLLGKGFVTFDDGPKMFVL